MRYRPTKLWKIENVNWDPRALDHLRSQCKELGIDAPEMPSLLHCYIFNAVALIQRRVSELDTLLSRMCSTNRKCSAKRADVSIDFADFLSLEEELSLLEGSLKLQAKRIHGLRGDFTVAVQGFVLNDILEEELASYITPPSQNTSQS